MSKFRASLGFLDVAGRFLMWRLNSLRRPIGFAFGTAILLLWCFESMADKASSLTVSITPQRAVTDGAVWRWRASGATQPSLWYRADKTVMGIGDGDILVEFFQPSNSPCRAPQPATLRITPGKAEFVLGEYLGKTCM